MPSTTDLLQAQKLIKLNPALTTAQAVKQVRSSAMPPAPVAPPIAPATPLQVSQGVMDL